MDDLAAFLRAQWDAEEAAAKAATAGPWFIGEPVPYSDPGSGLSIEAGDDEVAGPGHSGGGVWSQADADHILRHDPARVLADIAAKRRILDEHAIVQTKAVGEGLRAVDVDVCQTCSNKHGIACTTVRLLALPHADHHDYQEKWRP